jgi:hypothetical protein
MTTDVFLGIAIFLLGMGMGALLTRFQLQLSTSTQKALEVGVLSQAPKSTVHVCTRRL